MPAAMPWLLSGLGLVILLLAGDSLVKGAVNLSLRLGLPALIVSLTIVAFGTSAPELLIAIEAILDDAPGIAMGNVVGSNTATSFWCWAFRRCWPRCTRPNATRKRPTTT